jgi:hypothetical protein
MVPTLGAALITGTRIMDARHHPFDVISGAMLGILVSWASYRQYFPPVTETWRKGRAYPIRAWGRGPAAPPSANPTIMVDEDVQPLRPMPHPMDVERGEASGFSSNTAVAGDSEHGGNVFRQQIHDSQRRRQNPYAVDRSDTLASSNYRSDTMGSTISTKVSNYQNQMPAANPFQGQRRNDTYDGYCASADPTTTRKCDGAWTATHRLSNGRSKREKGSCACTTTARRGDDASADIECTCDSRRLLYSLRRALMILCLARRLSKIGAASVLPPWHAFCDNCTL